MRLVCLPVVGKRRKKRGRGGRLVCLSESCVCGGVETVVGCTAATGVLIVHQAARFSRRPLAPSPPSHPSRWDYQNQAWLSVGDGWEDDDGRDKSREGLVNRRVATQESAKKDIWRGEDRV